MQQNHRTLLRLNVGQESKIVRVFNQDVSLRRRLMELGLLPGTLVKVLRVSPFGDPIEIFLRGYCLSIRRNEAASIEIK